MPSRYCWASWRRSKRLKASCTRFAPERWNTAKRPPRTQSAVEDEQRNRQHDPDTPEQEVVRNKVRIAQERHAKNRRLERRHFSGVDQRPQADRTEQQRREQCAGRWKAHASSRVQAQG